MVEGETEAPNKKQQPCHPCGCPEEPSLKTTALGQHPTAGDPGPETRGAGIWSFNLFTQKHAPSICCLDGGAPGSQETAPRLAALCLAPPPKVAECGSFPQSRGLPAPRISSHPALGAAGGGRARPLCGGVCPRPAVGVPPRGNTPHLLLFTVPWACSLCPRFPSPPHALSLLLLEDTCPGMQGPP